MTLSLSSAPLRGESFRSFSDVSSSDILFTDASSFFDVTTEGHDISSPTLVMFSNFCSDKFFSNSPKTAVVSRLIPLSPNSLGPRTLTSHSTSTPCSISPLASLPTKPNSGNIGWDGEFAISCSKLEFFVSQEVSLEVIVSLLLEIASPMGSPGDESLPNNALPSPLVPELFTRDGDSTSEGSNETRLGLNDSFEANEDLEDVFDTW